MGEEKSNPSKRPLIIAILVGALLIAIGLAVGLGVGLQDSDSDSASSGSSSGDGGTGAEYLSATGEYRYASVSSDTDICSQIGTDIMARGRGNAFDASTAAMFCVGLVNAHSCGIGGGSFIVFYDKKNGEWYTINSREKAPGAAHRDMYADDLDDSIYGGLASGIPGEVRGLWMLHSRMGLLPWSEVVRPSISLCEDGIPLSEAHQYAVNVKLTSRERRQAFPEYFDDDGNVKEVGTLIQKPKLAETFRKISEDPFAFYNGSLAQDIVADNKDAGGIFELEDLANYEAKWAGTNNLTLPDGHVLHSIDAPGSGPVLNYMLNILAGYEMDPSHVSSTEDEILTYHRAIEAFKFAFGKRTELGDSDFVDVTEHVANMTDLVFGEKTRALIDDDRTQEVAYYDPSGQIVVDSGTAHMSVVDGEGNIVAITSTINHYFGSLVVGERTGIIFNNEMNDFSVPNTTNAFGVPATEANFIEPGKRPMSSMCPTIVWDTNTNTPKLVTGASGGTKITTGVALNIMDVLWLGRGVAESVDRMRLHHQLVPTELELEDGFSEEIAAGLREKGHVTAAAGSFSVVQAIQFLEDKLMAVADFRKGGVPDGF